MGSLHRIAVLCGLTAVLATSVAQAEDWKVAKNEDGIKVSLSEVPGSDYKSYQGVALMKTTVAKLRALQEDVAGACAWIHECKTQKLLKHEGDKSWTYSQFNTPWPVTPRDSVIEVTTVEGADGSLTRNLRVCRRTFLKKKALSACSRSKASGSSYRRATRLKSLIKCTPSRAAACRQWLPTSSSSMRRSTP